MSAPEAITPSEFRNLLTTPDFCGQMDDILFYSDKTHHNAGFAVYRAAGGLGLSEAIHEHSQLDLTLGDDGLARPDLMVTVHTHKPNLNGDQGSGVLSPKDLRQHVILDSVRPGLVSIVAKQFGQDFSDEAFTTLHMARRNPSAEAAVITDQLEAIDELPDVIRSLIHWDQVMQENGLVSVRGRYTAPHLRVNQSAETPPPKYQPSAAQLARQLFWGTQ